MACFTVINLDSQHPNLSLQHRLCVLVTATGGVMMMVEMVDLSTRGISFILDLRHVPFLNV